MAVLCDRIFSVLLFSLSSAFWSSIVHIHISVVRTIRYEALVGVFGFFLRSSIFVVVVVVQKIVLENVRPIADIVW